MPSPAGGGSSHRSGWSAASCQTFEMSVAERIKAFEHSASSRNAIERTQVQAEVHQLRTEVQAAMTAADQRDGTSRSEAKAALKQFEYVAEQALQSAQIRGSGVIASTEAWIQTQEQSVKLALDQWAQASETQARLVATGTAEADAAAAGATVRVDSSLASMSQLFESERLQQRREWDRERDELIRVVQQERAEAARAREETARQVREAVAAAREAQVAEVERLRREAQVREAEVLASASRAHSDQANQANALKRECLSSAGTLSSGSLP